VSSRRSEVVTIRLPVEGPLAPNATIEQITVQVRVHYPPNTHPAGLRAAVEVACTETLHRLGL
jgi:hypothetical protein